MIIAPYIVDSNHTKILVTESFKLGTACVRYKFERIASIPGCTRLSVTVQSYTLILRHLFQDTYFKRLIQRNSQCSHIHTRTNIIKMGQPTSKPNPINPTETQAFPEILKENEIKKLKKRFDKMDTNKNGKLSVEEIMTIPGLEHNPLVSRVIETFDTNNDGEINFMEFVQGISRFSAKTSKEDKLQKNKNSLI